MRMAPLGAMSSTPRPAPKLSRRPREALHPLPTLPPAIEAFGLLQVHYPFEWSPTVGKLTRSCEAPPMPPFPSSPPPPAPAVPPPAPSLPPSLPSPSSPPAAPIAPPAPPAEPPAPGDPPADPPPPTPRMVVSSTDSGAAGQSSLPVAWRSACRRPSPPGFLPAFLPPPRLPRPPHAAGRAPPFPTAARRPWRQHSRPLLPASGPDALGSCALRTHRLHAAS